MLDDDGGVFEKGEKDVIWFVLSPTDQPGDCWFLKLWSWKKTDKKIEGGKRGWWMDSVEKRGGTLADDGKKMRRYDEQVCVCVF